MRTWGLGTWEKWTGNSDWSSRSKSWQTTVARYLSFPWPIHRSPSRPGHTWADVGPSGATRTRFLWACVTGLQYKQVGIIILILPSHFKKSAWVACLNLHLTSSTVYLFSNCEDYWDSHLWCTTSCIWTISSGYISRCVIPVQECARFNCSWNTCYQANLLVMEAIISVN